MPSPRRAPSRRAAPGPLGHRLRARIIAIHSDGPYPEIEVAVADSFLCLPCTPARLARSGWQVGQTVALLIPADAAVLLGPEAGRP